MTKTQTVDRWRHLTASAFARAEIVPAAQQFVGTMRTQRFGAVDISQVEVGRHRVNRSVEHVRSSREHNLIVGLQLGGNSLIIQDGRIAALSPGDIAVYSTARPYSIVADEPMVCMGVKLPPTMLTVQDGLLENVTARCLSPDNTLRTSFIEVLRAAAHPDAPLSDAARPLTARMLGDMVSIMCINEAELLGLVDTPQTDEDLIAEVLAYAYAHLSDPALTAGEVAASCHISVRTLYHLLAARGIKLSAWIRTQRLEKCRHALADPQLAHLPVAQIAARWGFRNAAYFSTVFRAEFGSSPDAYRRRTRTAAELTEAGPR
ncbi:helix-turn-helix domain-containing protein [Corynebacterium sp. YIM 101645]|uniref:Helix-turn-helix domain-containing protein n=1 Tax=Corynebacterium lemuris TaxID=1859292 RepID=A0ABT2FU82_9CORY|nr:helix-turn-helix domain-containing protein [Corynebacterium lemuris]